MVCTSCGTENPPGKRFCGDCGSPLASGCPACGASNPPDKRFCGDCGTPLTTTSPTVAAAGAPVRDPVAVATGSASAERRLVSILFADLVGFTTIAEGKDAEDTRELLTRYFDLARDVIGRYGGTVEKFIGDAVMAVWGAPIAHEDDAERAVRAGLDLVDAVRSLGPDIAARAGVLTGEAAVTIGATNQGLVAGDIVNTASRLQSAAAPGSVLVGESTERAASRAIAFEPVGDQALKGKTLPVPAWRALRVIAQIGGRNRSDTLEAPFVGRDDELRLIKDLFHATTRERRARLVSVIGPAGIGKTRLAWEFAKYRDGLVEAIWFHDGRSPAYGEGISFWALGEMIRRRAGLLETDDEPTTRAKVAASVAEHVASESDRRWVESALLALLGVDAGTIAPDELFAAWRTFFEGMAATAPVVMVFEDFHYADGGLIDFVDHLLEWSRSFPIYVLTLARPELIERRPAWGAGKRSFTSIFLEPLPPATMGLLLRGLIPGLPEVAEQAIVTRADGIPLYAVETVRMLVSEGKLTLEDGVYRPNGDLTSLAVPETLTALIASRLDALPPDERALTADAAVLGQSFTTPGLEVMSGLDAETLATRLRSLVRREILRVETDPRSPERGQYVFVQALIREVAYNALAKRDRKSRHLAAARFFESLGTDEVAGGLAGHYLAAHRNSVEGPEADAVAAQARIALTAAANRAAGLGSHDQALMFFEQAMTVTTDPSETAGLLQRAGTAASLAGRHETAETLLRRALEGQRALGNRRGIAGATEALGRTLLAMYRTADAIALLAPAVDELADIATEPEGIALTSQLARANYLYDNNRTAIELADKVLEAAEHANLRAILADTLVTKGTALGALGRPIEGLAEIGAGRDVAEADGFGETVLRAINNIAYIQTSLDPRSGCATSRAGLALARRLGVRGMIASMLQNIGEFSLRMGDWAAALGEIESVIGEDWDPADRMWLLVSVSSIRALRGEDVSERMAEVARIQGDQDDIQVQANVGMTSALVAFAGGDLELARTLAKEAGELATPLAPITLPRAARAALWAGNLAGAREDLALVDATGVHGPSVEADRRTVQAGIAALEGRTGDARAMYRDALRAWRDLGLAFDEALCGLDMALLLDPSDPEIQAAAQASRETLAGLGAVPFVERLDAALARHATGRPSGPTAPVDASLPTSA